MSRYEGSRTRGNRGNGRGFVLGSAAKYPTLPRLPWRASALFPSLLDLFLGRAAMAVPILTLPSGQGHAIPQKSVPGGYPP
jgi:hypothetical protein